MIKYIVTFVAAAFLLVTFATITERLVWVNSSYYPLWLSKKIDYPPIENGDDVVKARGYFEKICGKNIYGFTVAERKNGTFVRCDTSISYTSWIHGVYRINDSEKQKNQREIVIY